MEPPTEPGASTQDWMNREMQGEAVSFRKAFEEIMCKEDNVEDMEKFMAKSDEHPRFVWLDLLLSSPSKNKSGNDSVETELASLMWTCLIKYFPDVLHRELFLDSFHWINSEEITIDRIGALHGAVLCGRPEIVQLLSDHRTKANLVGKGISRRLKMYLECELGFDRTNISSDCFNNIKRAILWRHLPNPSEYMKVAEFLKDFETTKDSNNEEQLQSFIENVFQMELVIEEKWRRLTWTVILAWASAFGRGDIIGMFKILRPHLFENLRISHPWKSFLSDSPDVIYTREEPVTRLAVEKIVKIVDQLMTDVESSKSFDTAHNDIVMQVCSLYNLSYRVPTFLLRPDCCNSRWTAIHLAAALGDHAVLDALIESHNLLLKKFPAEWKIKFQNRSGCTTIEKYLHDSLCDALLMTPLHHAVFGNHLLVVKTLLKWDVFNSHLNGFDIFQRTAFQIACSDSARISILKELVSSPGIDMNTKDCCEFTPLHWAVYVGATEVVRVLVSQAKRIRPMAKTEKGQHPYRVAEDLDPVKKKDIQALLESIPEVKDDVERVYRDRQVYVDAANAILVGAALIASVTFGGWMQPPLGDGHESTDANVRIYWVFNSLSFFFAIGTVMAGANTVLPQADVYIGDAVETIRTWLVNTAFMLIWSIVFVLGAFAAAGFSSSSLVPHLNVNMVSTMVIGTTICSMLGMSFCLRLFRIRRSTQLWETAKNTLKWLKHEPCFSDTSTHFSKFFRDLCFAPEQESHAGRDKGSLKVLQKVFKDVRAEEHGTLQGNLTEILHPYSGNQICHIRRCHKDLAIESKVSDEWLNAKILPQNKAMWEKILAKLKVLSIAKPRKHASFLFQDESGELTLPSGTDQILERYGIVKVEKDKELLRHLESLNRQGHADLIEDYRAFGRGHHLREANPSPGVTQQREKKVLLFGRVGSGKSTVANALVVGDIEPVVFPISSAAQRNGEFWTEKGGLWTIVETAGLGDAKIISDAEVKERLQQFLQCAKGEFSHIIYVISGARPLTIVEEPVWRTFTKFFEGAEDAFTILFTAANEHWLETQKDRFPESFKKYPILVTDIPPVHKSQSIERRLKVIRTNSIRKLESDLEDIFREREYRYCVPSIASMDEVQPEETSNLLQSKQKSQILYRWVRGGG